MKLLILSVLVAVAAASPLLGSERCTWGPSYWCSHIKAAKECNAVQHCISTVWKNQKLPTVKDVECDTCKSFVGEVKTALSNNATQNDKKGELCDFCKDTMKEALQMLTQSEKQIQTYLENACGMIPNSNLSAECKTLVDEYFPEIMAMIVAQLDPQVICTAAGFCKQGLKDTVPGHKVQEPKKLLPVKKESLRLNNDAECELCQFVVTAAASEVKNNKTQFGGFAQCEMCKQAIEELKKIDESEKKQQEVEQFIIKYLCSRLGSSSKKCADDVKLYGPIIFDFLAQELDPTTICKALGLCASAQKVSIESLLKLKNGAKKPAPMLELKPAKAAPKKLHTSTQCVLCEFVMRELDSILQKNSTEEEIKAGLEKVCSILPSSVSQDCDAFIKQYADTIFKILVDEFDPEKVCVTLGICKATKRVSVECNQLVSQYGPAILKLLVQELNADMVCKVLGLCSSTSRVPKFDFEGEGCNLCETVMMYMSALLKEPNTVTTIEQELERVCNFLPDTPASVCDGIVLEFGPKIIEAFVNRINPKDICQFIGLCPKTKSLKVNKSKIIPNIVGKVIAKQKASAKCVVCEYVMNEIISILGENRTEKSVVAALDKVCSIMPKSVKAECDDFVRTYGPMVVEMLVQELNPKLICTTLKLCDPTIKDILPLYKMISPAKPRLVGESKCTYGPAYWCANFENAKKCNAVEHCNKHVWSNEV